MLLVALILLVVVVVVLVVLLILIPLVVLLTRANASSWSCASFRVDLFLLCLVGTGGCSCGTAASVHRCHSFRDVSAAIFISSC